MNNASAPRRLVDIVWRAALAFALTALAGGIWTVLLAANLATSAAVPWAVVVMAALLWALWRYLGGAWRPRRTADARRQLLRARRVSAPTFAWAVAAGLLAIVALAGLWVVLFQLARLPARTLLDYSRYPFLTVALALVMASLVNAVAEEALFRGYLQGTLEGRVGGLAAILITMLLMAPEHAVTQGFVWPTLLFYFAVDVMLGVTAYLTQSIVPGIVTHSVGLLVFFTLVWPGDMLRRFIGQFDANAWLWIHSAQVIVFAALAILAFLQLARRTQEPHALQARLA